ncbi:hypothetical protein CPC08DRAFT_767077 [Agrocybe pediades]|nr:hypothetical protein CPC08DRAFT_767077 [Agrocybe pediades]
MAEVSSTSRPKRSAHPSSKLTDSSNVAEPELRSHQEVRERAAGAHDIISTDVPTTGVPNLAPDLSGPPHVNSEPSITTSGGPGPSSLSPPPAAATSHRSSSPLPSPIQHHFSPWPSDFEPESGDEVEEQPRQSSTNGTNKRKAIVVSDDEAASQSLPKPKKKKRKVVPVPTQVVSDADESEPEVIENVQSKTKDINAFFKPPVRVEGGKMKRPCIHCKYVQ